MVKRRNRGMFKKLVCLALTGVMLFGEGTAFGAFGGGLGTAEVAAAETVQVEALTYGPDGPDLTMDAVTDATFWFCTPYFNNQTDYNTIGIAEVWDDLVVEELQEDGVTWLDIDKKSRPESPYIWGQDWGWEVQQWSSDVRGCLLWFKTSKTTHLRFRSISHPDVKLVYNLNVNKVAAEVTSLACTGTDTNQTLTGTGQAWIHFNQLSVNGKTISSFALYQEYEKDLDLLVDNHDGEGFVPLSANPDSGFIWGTNFEMWYDYEGGIFFTGVTRSFTVRFQSKSHPDVKLDYVMTWVEPNRTNWKLSTTGAGDPVNTDLSAISAENPDAHTASVGLVLPYIGGTSPVQTDLDKFTYQIQIDGKWVNLADTNASQYVYQGNGYNKYSDKSQWGYFTDHVYGLWLQPVIRDTKIRVGYPEDGQKPEDGQEERNIGDNWIYYNITGDPQGIIPDVKDMADIEVDMSSDEPTGDVQDADISVPEGWQMIWHDEFNGSALDDSKWSNQTGYLLNEDDIGTAGWGNNEDEWYTDSPKNTSVHDGKLNLTMLPEEKTFTAPNGSATAKYSSGKLISKNKFSVKYGRVDFRAKLPAGNGIWPAMWMMPNDDVYGTWSASGEIDVFEGKGRSPHQAYGTLHYGGLGELSANRNTGDFIDMVANGNKKEDYTNWHVYSVVWEEGNIKIYADGKCYFKCTSETFYSVNGNENAPFDQRFYLIMNLAAGGWFDGGIKPDADFQRADMYVDYVRVYQKEVQDGEDEKPDDQRDGEDKWKTNGASDGLYGDYKLGVVIPATGLSLDKETLSLSAGASETLTATVEPANATNKSITWTSSDESVATVKNGVVKGLKTGSATITAKLGDFTKTCAVTVTGINVTGISLDKTTLDLTAGETGKLTATIAPADASNKNVTWSSADKSIATVASDGTVTAVKSGTTEITAKAEGGDYTAKCTVTVKAKPVTGVTLNKTTLELRVGKTGSLTATVAPSDAGNKNVSWESSDNSVATVSNGTVTAIKVGTAKITVKTEDGNKTAECTVNVVESTADVYEIEAGKGLEYDEGKITFYVKNAPTDKNITVFMKVYDSEDEARERAKNPVVDGTNGYPLVNDGSGTWTYVSNETYAEGKCVLFLFNIIDSAGAGVNTAWGVYPIENTSATAVEYTTEYYLEQPDGTFGLIDSVTKKAEPSTSVTAVKKTYTGYVLDEEAEGSKLTGTVTEDGKLTLKLFYRKKNSGGSGNAYEFMEGRTIEYANGTLTFSATANGTITHAEVFFKTFDTEEEAKAIKDLAPFGGSNLMKDDGNGTWTFTKEIPDLEGKYIAFFNNVIVDGAGTPMEILVYQIPEKAVSVSGSYKVQYYLENEAKDDYVLKEETEELSGTVGDTVWATMKTYTGFTKTDHTDAVASGTIKADGTLILKLYYTRDTYDISYTLNGGTQNTANPTTYVYGVGVPELKNPTQEGHTFEGWYAAADFTGAKTEKITAAQTGDVTLYAKWTKDEEDPDPEPETRTGRGVEYKDGKLTFYVADSAAGTTGAKVYYKVYASEEEALAGSADRNTQAMKSADLTYDEEANCWTVTVEEELTEESYLLYAFDFIGGTEEGMGDWNIISGSIASSGQISAASYQVEYYQQNVSKDAYTRMASETKKGIAGATVRAATRSYTGFTYNAAAADGKASGEVAADGSLVLKLYYDRDEYPISYNLNGGTQNAENPSSYAYGVGVAELKAPTRSGYTFEGWYAAADFTGAKIEGITAAQTGEVNVYAKWSENKVKDDDPAKVDAKAPTISADPASKSCVYMQPATVSVTAASVDGGTLSYQWHRNTVNSATGATAISGATSASYTVPTTAVGTTYYFCVVTNTNNNVTGSKTATANSKIAAITVTKAANSITGVSSKYIKKRKDKAFTLKAKGEGEITYTSSDKKVAVVDSTSGKVTIKGYGRTTITIQAAGNANYAAATRKVTIDVAPYTSIKKVQSKKSKTMTVTWKKDKNAGGYQVQYSTDKNFKKSVKTKKVKKSTTGLIVKKLTGKKTYYVRIRAYKKVGKTTVYSNWSKAKKVKVKK